VARLNRRWSHEDMTILAGNVEAKRGYDLGRVSGGEGEGESEELGNHVGTAVTQLLTLVR
jgi:hypothetical protein